VQDALHAQPGTLHHVTEASGQISLLGQSGQLSLAGFSGDARWTGYATIAGHWYNGPGQVDVNTAFVTATGATVGQQYTLASGGKHVTGRSATAASPARSSWPSCCRHGSPSTVTTAAAGATAATRRLTPSSGRSKTSPR
jgi:hypothetical protein